MNETIIAKVVLTLFVALLCWAAIEDFKRYRIPNFVSLGLLALYPAYVFLSATPVDWVLSIALGFVVLAVGFIFFATGVMGAGDVKLMSTTSIWAGLTGYMLFLQVTIVASVIVALVVAYRAALVMERERRASLAGGEMAQVSLGFTGFMSALGSIRHAPLSKLTIPYGAAIAAGGVAVALFKIGLR